MMKESQLQTQALISRRGFGATRAPNQEAGLTKEVQGIRDSIPTQQELAQLVAIRAVCVVILEFV